jgi:hypothetical protein
MKTNESKIKGKIMDKAREIAPSFVWLRIEDRFTSGIPDIHAAGLGYGSWWEVKYADPDFDSNGAQELMMLRMEGALGFAYYVIYVEEGVLAYTKKHIRILTPRQFGEDWKTAYTHIIPGFDHAALVEFIVKKHRRML